MGRSVVLCGRQTHGLSLGSDAGAWITLAALQLAGWPVPNRTMRLSFRPVFALILVVASISARGESTQPNPELKALLDDLATTATAEQVGQIADAISASPLLIGELNALASSKKLAKIVVPATEPSVAAPGPRFGARLEGSTFMILAPLLKELQRNQLSDVAVGSDVLYPNNTTFVLAHLTYHLAKKEDRERFDGEFKRKVGEKSKEGSPLDLTELLMQAQRNALGEEAGAFIFGWNCVVDAATQVAKDKQVMVRYAPGLLLNLRYRFAIVKAIQASGAEKIQIPASAVIELNDRNIDAVIGVLKRSAMVDIQ
jgi:hypothetical protein